MEESPNSKTFGYYFILLASHATSVFGSLVVQFIIIWWISSETSSPFYLSLIFFWTFLPQVIITLFAGVISDILDRKIILIITNILRISTTFVLIFLFAFGTFELNLLLLISIVRSISQTFYLPTFYTILPSMVSQKHLGRINGLTYLLTAVIQVFAPIYVALLFDYFHLFQSLLVMVIVSGIILIPLFLIKIPQTKETKFKTEDHRRDNFLVYYFKHFIEGFRSIKLFPSIFILIGTIMMLEYLNLVFTTFLPYYISILHAGTIFEFAIISSFLSIGIIVGSIVFIIRKYWNPTIKIFFLSTFLIFLGNLVFILAPYRLFGILLVVNFINGFHLVFVYTMFITFIQSTIPNNKLGRVSAISFFLTSLMTPFALFQINFIFQLFSDVKLFLFLTTIVGIIFLIAVYLFTGIRKIKVVNYKLMHNQKA